jgi:hypothetical protein
MKRSAVAGFCLIAAGLLCPVLAQGEVYSRAPETLPWILPEMNTPAYWIARAKNPDAVIMTPAEIRAMNENYVRRITAPDPFGSLPVDIKPDLFYWWPGLVTFTPDLHRLSPQAVADTVKYRLRAELAFLRSMEFGNALAVEYSEKDLAALENNMALDTVGNAVTVRDGIAVRNARLRNNTSFFPEQVGMMQTGKSRWDGWNIGIVKIGSPVSVLHRSRDGEYLFVLNDLAYGWVRSEDIAFGSRKEIEAFAQAEPFVICTGDRVNFYGEQECRYAAGWFGMSARLPLASAANPRQIRVPVRKTDGSMAVENAWLAEKAEVNIGLLPYTRRNIITTAFKLIGTTYDWSGAWYGRQHETIYQDIFACFGFRLPNYAALFSFYGDNREFIKPEIGKVRQYQEILKHEPFVTIQNCGAHSQILLGDFNGMPIVFDQHGYGYIDSNSMDREIRRCHVGDVSMPPYFLTKKVMFLRLAK